MQLVYVSGCWYVVMLPTTGVDPEKVAGGGHTGLVGIGAPCAYIALSVVGGSGGMLPRKFRVCESGIGDHHNHAKVVAMVV